jgi:hypothetical protein
MNPRLNSARHPFDLHTSLKAAISGKRRTHAAKASRSLS